MNEGKVHSLSKAIDLLDLLCASGVGLRLSELSARSGYPKSTTHALLSTMRDRGLVSQREDGRYAPGIRLFEYGSAVSRGLDIGATARPYLEKLATLTSANAVITMLDDAGAVSFDYAASPTGVQILPEIGVRLPLHATSQGKLLLAAIPPAKAERMIRKSKLQPYTPHTADAESLLSELPLIRERGYAVEDGEYKIGLRSVSAPVTVNSQIHYALTAIGFFRKVRSDEFIAAVNHTVEQAKRLSAALDTERYR